MMSFLGVVSIALCLIVVSCVASLESPSSESSSGIKHLKGDPDYRKIRLHWDWFENSNELGTAPSISSFQIYYCELQAWGPHRCKTKVVKEDSEHNFVTNNRKIKSFSADVEGLRMATTYTFEVRSLGSKSKTTEEDRDDRANENLQDFSSINENSIVIETKGFSARASLCLPSVSEVDVETGPFFGGRVSVENTEGKEKCSIDGDANSARDVYTLRINHEECGSVVNETTVATFIIVQENLPILTHSTRRFLVLCTFQPDTLTVRAGLSLPSGHGGHGFSQIESIPYENMINEVRQSRQIAPPQIEKPVSHILLSIILVMCGIFAITAGFLRWHRKRLMDATQDIDTLSIASSERSFATTTDSDSVVPTISNRPVLRPLDGDVFTVEMRSSAL